MGAVAKQRRLRVIEGLLWLVVAVLFVWRITPQLRAAGGGPAGGGGFDARRVTLDLLNGTALPLDALKGQVVLVNFWATWCPPCRAEMPGIQAVFDARRARGFTVIGISTDQSSRQAVGAFLQEHHITYPVAMTTRETDAAFGGVNDLPTSFLLDRRGHIRYTVRGIFAPETLRDAVDRLLAEDR
jgi:peroxiredoxin